MVTVEWSPSGDKVIGATAPEYGEFRIWDSVTGTLVTENTGSIFDMQWNHARTQLALATLSSIDILEWSTMTVIAGLDVPDTPNIFYSLAWHPNGIYSAGGTHIGEIIIGNAVTGQVINTLAPNNSNNYPYGYIASLAFDSSGAYLYSLSGEGLVRVYHWQTNEILHEMSIPTPIYGAVWTTRGELIYSTEESSPQIYGIPVVGNYTLTATPYSDTNRTGTAGTGYPVNFMVR